MSGRGRRDETGAALARAAERMRELLREACEQLDPFPPFPGAFFSYGIEIEAPEVESPERGCVVLAPDGELYELRMGQDVPAMALELTDPVALRQEELKKLELEAGEYIVYASNALTKVLELLVERRSQAKR